MCDFTEEEIKQEMDKAIRESLDIAEVTNFAFDMVQKAFLKGMELGIKIGKGEK